MERNNVLKIENNSLGFVSERIVSSFLSATKSACICTVPLSRFYPFMKQIDNTFIEHFRT